jgi:hypothetical protein
MENKKFDAVQLMRQVRDKMTSDLQAMSFEEQRDYIERHATRVREDLALRQETSALRNR